jgi:hypothetical protein
MVVAGSLDSCMSAFGGATTQHPYWAAIIEYGPLAVFALILLSVVVFQIWLLHVTAIFVLLVFCCRSACSKTH